MSAPFSPAAWTATRISPLPGSGSGWSSTATEPSLMVAARIPAPDPIDGCPWRRDTGAMLRGMMLAAGVAMALAAPAYGDVVGPARSTWIPDGEVKAVALSG